MNIYAHTACGCNYPEFISVNKTEHGEVQFVVRSRALEFGFCGPTAEITLSQEMVLELVRKLGESR